MANVCHAPVLNTNKFSSGVRRYMLTHTDKDRRKWQKVVQNGWMGNS